MTDVLLGYWDYSAAQLVIFCPKCKIWHRHGKGSGSRAPHCSNEGYGSNYEIREFMPSEYSAIVKAWKIKQELMKDE